MFTQEQKIKLKQLLQDISYNLLPLDRQEAIQRDGFVWCADWWTIEILKCLFLGEEVYRRDPPPRRLRNNPMLAMEDRCIDAERKRNMFKILKENIDFSDTIVICEVGRGIDLLIASMVKNWSRYIVYDSNPYVLEKVKNYFVDRLGLPVETACMPSNKYELPTIRPLTIVANNTKGLDSVQWFPNKEKEILFIYDGTISGECQCQPILDR